MASDTTSIAPEWPSRFQHRIGKYTKPVKFALMGCSPPNPAFQTASQARRILILRADNRLLRLATSSLAVDIEV